jgi:hypothetical protein
MALTLPEGAVEHERPCHATQLIRPLGARDEVFEELKVLLAEQQSLDPEPRVLHHHQLLK